jgi:hypothetical protein
MAKRDKLLPARRQRARAEDSLLIRSAESLGRVIGSLQRQLDGATKRLTSNDGDGTGSSSASGDGNGVGGVTRSRASAREGTASPKPKRARKPAAAKKAAGPVTETRTRASIRRPAAAAKKNGGTTRAKKTAAKGAKRR